MTARMVLFDLGNVVVDWDPTRLYTRLLGNREEAERFYRDICTLEWHTAHDRGVSMADNARDLINRHPQHADLIRAWDTGWLDMFHGYVAGVPDIIQELNDRNTPLFALTNFPSEKWEDTVSAFPLLDVFADVVISSREKMVKPDPRIYELTLSRMGSPNPDQVFFIDDRVTNVEAARKVGMHAAQFTNAAQLRADLKAQGLL